MIIYIGIYRYIHTYIKTFKVHTIKTIYAPDIMLIGEVYKVFKLHGPLMFVIKGENL